MTNEPVKVMKGGALIDGNGGAILKDPILVIERGRIKDIGQSTQPRIPENAEIVDVGDHILMPGMFDCHLHIAAYNVITFHNYRAAIFEVTPQLEQFYALFHAQLCFERGFTTLRDMGRFTPFGGSFTAELCAVRDAINAGIFSGPRLIVSGRATVTSSHLDLSLPRAAKRPAGMLADGPWELRRMTREQLRIGCDWIKTCVSGGGGTDQEEPDIRNMTLEELAAIVDEAHAANKRCAVHCFTPEAHRSCLKAGVDTIEHIVFSDDETTKMIKDSAIPVTSTLIHRTDHAIALRQKAGTPQSTLEKMKKIQSFAFASFKRFHQAGIKIALGTDTGYEPEMGGSAKELEIYVDLGMTPMEALQAATKNSAEALHLDKDLGTLEKGKLADIIVVEGNPAKDVTVLQDPDNIKMVMKEGHIYVDKISAQKKAVIQSPYGSWKIIDK